MAKIGLLQCLRYPSAISPWLPQDLGMAPVGAPPSIFLGFFQGSRDGRGTAHSVPRRRACRGSPAHQDWRRDSGGLRGQGWTPGLPPARRVSFQPQKKSNIYRAGPSQEFPHWPQLRVTLSWVPGTARASRPAATPKRPVTKRQPRAHQVWLRVSRDGATNTLDTALRQGHRDATIATRCPLEG